ncbi:MAG TPA: hypothetical protein VHY37_04185 [Tepidisphaeraceae bacterium]|jgi:hypothetical protein|nr:hypothetical protein [Tepidisphaeraceae bacterium]
MIARYVVLHHTGIPEPHYDLMFDTGDGSRLITWRSPIWPIDRPTTLTRLPDHRREYLTYEGEISGDRGRGDRVTTGLCELAIGDELSTVRWSDALLAPLLLMRQSGDNWVATMNGVVQ